MGGQCRDISNIALLVISVGIAKTLRLTIVP